MADQKAQMRAERDKSSTSKMHPARDSSLLAMLCALLLLHLEIRPQDFGPSGANLTFESYLPRALAQMSNSKAPLIYKVTSGPLIPAFASERAAGGCKCRNRTTSKTTYKNPDKRAALQHARSAMWRFRVDRSAQAVHRLRGEAASRFA